MRMSLVDGYVATSLPPFFPHKLQSISVISAWWGVATVVKSYKRGAPQAGICHKPSARSISPDHPNPPSSFFLSSAPTRQTSFRVAALGIILTILFDPNIQEILGAVMDSSGACLACHHLHKSRSRARPSSRASLQCENFQNKHNPTRSISC